MNLNISYNWLKEYIKTAEAPQEFAKKMSLCGPAVDHLIETKPNFEKVVVGEILELAKHPNADKLSVCQVSIGGKTPLNIVCAAPNIKAGQKVPVVLVGGKVGTFEVVKAKIRGVESEGMMCSQKELGVGEDHTGIYILPDYVEVGLPLQKVMPINDVIFDMEITSNRPDAMSVIGMAREASAILGAKFIYSDPKPNLKVLGEEKKLAVSVKEPKLCRRYQAAVMTQVKVDDSPLWMQQRLLAAGLRPINNLVDITNYILLEFGQPMHVFDWEKLSDREIIVRLAKKGEKILALDGKEYELKENNLVIADGRQPVAVAGVMGGELSAASGETKTIVLECANFDPVTVRRTARELNLHSESSDLYEKDLSPQGTNPALMRAIELVMELAQGKMAEEIIDINNHKQKIKEIELDPKNVTKMLGVEIKKDKIIKILSALGFEVSNKKDGFLVSVPWWREQDMEGEHDLIEEVARIYGYHNLPTQLMAGELPVDFNDKNEFVFEDKIKTVLAGFGLIEIYSYSFISEKMIKNCGLKAENHIRIVNPLSLDFEYMRTSLLPGALKIIEENSGFYPRIDIFELSKIYLSRGNDIADEKKQLLIAAAESDANESFLKVKGYLEGLMAKLNITNWQVEKLKNGGGFWGQEALAVTADGYDLGSLGLVKKELLAAFDIKKSVAVALVDFAALVAAAKFNPSYVPIPKYPGVDLDLSMEVDEKVAFGAVADSVEKIDSQLIKNVAFLSEYLGEKVTQGKKALAIRISYRNDDKTLSLIQAQELHNQVVEKLKKEYNIKVR